MVIDTSAVVAILQDEPERTRFTGLIDADDLRLMSAVTRVECSFVIEGRKRDVGRRGLERLLGKFGVEVASVTSEQAELACEAFRRYGKGRHRARLNIGDCFAYALAKSTGEPLLFKGDDFPHTDVAAAA